MKKLFLSFVLCVLSLSAFAESWTDTNGVTWDFWAYNNGACIYGVTNCPAEVTVPGTVYIGETPYTVYELREMFRRNTTITSVTLPVSVTNIGEYAFNGCSSLTSVGDLSNVTSIGQYAFSGCSSLTSVNLSNVTSIEAQAFYGCSSLETVRLGETVPTLGSSVFHGVTLFYVPEAQLEAYRTATGWSEMRTRILAEDATHDYDVTVSVSNTSSAVLTAVGESNAENVVTLKVTGNINSYDIFAIRNKMPALRHLDLSAAHIVACPSYQYYGSYSTEDNIIGNSMFGNLGVVSILLPRDVTTVGACAFWGCANLCSVEIPASVKTIGAQAFYQCRALKTVILHNGLLDIYSSAFMYCSRFENITLPNTLQTIDGYVFYDTPLKEVTIPASVRSIGGYAFPSSVRKVYVAVVDPFAIQDNTFGDYKNCDLYVPKTAEWDATYQKYYWNTQWGQFASLKTWTPTYDNFYITNDYELDGGTIAGENGQNPDADFGAGSGFIVDGNGQQAIGEGHLNVNTGNGQVTNSGSLIGTGDNLTIETLYCDINIQGGRWYFFSFPFNVDLTAVTCKRTDNGHNANYVWRYYDGNQRAQGNGVGSNWKNQNSATDPNTLLAGTGYIFQANANAVLTIPMSNVSSANEQNATLVEHSSTDAANANWNFVGNPYLSYYEIEDIHSFHSPITVWNGSAYEALRPGDDDYTFTPFQAFFVQKPADATSVGFEAQNRETYNESRANAPLRAAARMARTVVNPDRLIVNLTLSDGVYTDKTRIVFNGEHSMDYEAECDASKFFADGGVPQLYTTYAGVHYAINERPLDNGECVLGYVADAAGELTLSAVRMDMPLLLHDNVTNTVFDLTLGDYTFTTETGAFNSRFVLAPDRTATGVADIMKATGVSVMATAEGIKFDGIDGQQVSIFSVSGQQVAAAISNGLVALPQGTYLVHVDDLTTKSFVR